ncbi:Predicted ester cyclase [Methylobacterium sp. 174MFSha1.1]|uniref:ester cyclase n=1 Tax=Methylobacterium sp. 174MFSha1.1 TaxID=1502749 RepID=UPI0008F2C746|nr:ester cyclase [Methylobacterium sp. 174MFSha1.1]SFU76623.1 Predicted ester cyclase [Methylobacterium sp. 174MFSha1.1]
MIRDVATAFYALLNARAFDRLGEVMAADCRTGVPGLADGPDAFGAMAAGYAQAFPDIDHAVLDTVREGDRIVVLTRTSGTHRAPFLGHPATGRRFCASGMDLLGFRGSLIVSRQAVFDTVTMLRQLGLYR